jgi:SAM-dependent methyltransferase
MAIEACTPADDAAGDAGGRAASGPRVLDAGCGPGRALDPLVDRGTDVLGIDESPGAVAVARERTGHPVAVGDLASLPLAAGSLDAALFLGTHVGTGGTVQALRSLLEELDRALAPGGRIVADLYDPTAVEAADLRAYLDDRWLEDGVATRRFRLRYDGEAGRWRTLLMASPEALESIVAPTPWSLARVERGEDTRYLFVLERE